MMRLMIFLSLVYSSLGQEEYVPRLDGRIVGGQGTTIVNHPHQVSLLLFSVHICGGAVISDTWVITAAHCVVLAPIPSLLAVRAGSSFRNVGGQVYSVLSIVIHPSYSETTLDYDIALLRLSAFVSTPNSRIIPVAPFSMGPRPGAPAVITGWGATTENGTAALVLQVITVPVISDEDCRAAYPFRITSRMFCAGLLGVGGKDACQGDSGGPVVIGGELYGLVSWGDGCARAESPGVYTNIPILSSWVNAISVEW